MAWISTPPTRASEERWSSFVSMCDTQCHYGTVTQQGSSIMRGGLQRSRILAVPPPLRLHSTTSRRCGAHMYDPSHPGSRGTRRPSAAGPGAALGGERSDGSDEPPGGSGRFARPATRQRWAATYVGWRRRAPVPCGRIISAGRGPGPEGGSKDLLIGQRGPWKSGPRDISRRARAPGGCPRGQINRSGSGIRPTGLISGSDPPVWLRGQTRRSNPTG